MIEIVFSDSACGSLKMAQHYGVGDYQDGSIGVFVTHSDGSKPTRRELRRAKQKAEERQRRAWENATPLGGNPADVFGFPLALSVGSVAENNFDEHRQQVLKQLYHIFPDDLGETERTAKEILQRAKDDWKALCARMATEEALRIWYSSQPDELCGLYWFMTQLDQLANPPELLYLVRLPEWETNENMQVLQKTSWGEVAPGEWHRYVSLQKPAPPLFRKSCAAHWQTLQQENAALRAVLNGQLVSVPETFYDDFILREIAAERETFQEAAVIGRILSKYRLGISDMWIALRIEELVRIGKLEVVSEVEKGGLCYRRTLKKCIKTY